MFKCFRPEGVRKMSRCEEIANQIAPRALYANSTTSTSISVPVTIDSRDINVTCKCSGPHVDKTFRSTCRGKIKHSRDLLGETLVKKKTAERLAGGWESLRYQCSSDCGKGEQEESEETPYFKPHPLAPPPHAHNIMGTGPFFVQSCLCKWILSYPYPDIHFLLWNLHSWSLF